MCSNDVIYFVVERGDPRGRNEIRGLIDVRNELVGYGGGLGERREKRGKSEVKYGSEIPPDLR